jgi:hypothetical protein
MRMKNERVIKKTFRRFIERREPVGRHKGRRIDAVHRDAKVMLKCKNWSVEDIDVWRRRIEEAEVQVGL